MYNFPRVLTFNLAVLGGLAVLAPPVRGSSIGFHEFLRHHHPDSLVLPPLNGPVPSSVPVFSNQGLIRFWQQHPNSPILRDPGIEMQLCQAVSERRDLNPARFDHFHPRLGPLLGDHQFLEYALHLYNLNTRRFVRYHHNLIPIIRGCVLMMMKHPTQGTSPETIQAPGSSMSSPVPGAINNGTGPTPPSAPETIAIPAPPSFVLLILGMGLLAIRIGLRRRPVAVS